jgi:hypothetical protein
MEGLGLGGATAAASAAVNALALGGNGAAAFADIAPDQRRKRVPMDPRTTHLIYQVYYSDPYVRMCRVHRYALVFKGEMRAVWGADGEPEEIEPAAHNDLKSLLELALDFRDMYGMVPFKIARPRGLAAAAGRSPEDLRQRGMPIVIPPVGSGTFVIHYNRRTKDSVVKFHTSDVGAAAEGEIFPVYVWPGRLPNPFSPTFKSPMATILTSHLRIKEMESNDADAHWRATHPVLMLQTPRVAVQPSHLTDREAHASIDDLSVSRVQVNAALQDNGRRIRAEAMAEAMAGQAHAVEQRSDTHITFGADGPGARTRSRAWDGGIMALPEGEAAAPTITPPVRPDVATARHEHYEMVCSALGVPYSRIIVNPSGRIKTDPDRERENLDIAVEMDRDDANAFYRTIYEALNRTTQDVALIRGLLLLDEWKKGQKSAGRAVPPEARARKESMRRTLVQPQRTRLVFTEPVVPKTVEPKMIIAAAAAGAVTKVEERNLWRASIGLPSIDEDHELAARPAPLSPAELAGANVAQLPVARPPAGAPAPRRPAASAGASAAAAKGRRRVREDGGGETDAARRQKRPRAS